MGRAILALLCGARDIRYGHLAVDLWRVATKRSVELKINIDKRFVEYPLLRRVFGSALMAKDHTGYRRLSPNENERLGFSRKARRYVPENERPSQSNAISNRKYDQIRTGISKEKATAQRSLGERSYRTNQAKTVETVIKERRQRIRESFQNGSRLTTKKDVDLIYQKMYGAPWHDWKESDRHAFSLLWGDLSQDDASALREILGSPPVQRKAA
jgi:hypothetical protein